MALAPPLGQRHPHAAIRASSAPARAAPRGVARRAVADLVPPVHGQVGARPGGRRRRRVAGATRARRRPPPPLPGRRRKPQRAASSTALAGLAAADDADVAAAREGVAGGARGSSFNVAAAVLSPQELARKAANPAFAASSPAPPLRACARDHQTRFISLTPRRGPTGPPPRAESSQTCRRRAESRLATRRARTGWSGSCG